MVQRASQAKNSWRNSQLHRPCADINPLRNLTLPKQILKLVIIDGGDSQQSCKILERHPFNIIFIFPCAISLCHLVPHRVVGMVPGKSTIFQWLQISWINAIVRRFSRLGSTSSFFNTTKPTKKSKICQVSFSPMQFSENTSYFH